MTEPSDSSKFPKLTKLDHDDGIGTTIVGGRPSGRRRQSPTISRGVEILVKKASVDPEFRTLLLEKRAEAAREIDLTLTTAEITLLNSVPQVQIEQIIANTTVPTEHRRVFLGRIAALMLAVLSAPMGGCDSPDFYVRGIRPEGHRPDMPVSPPRGIRPDMPEKLSRCKPEDIRLDREGKRFSYEVLVQGSDSVLIAVTCSRPLRSGELVISCRSGDRKGKVEIVYRSNRVEVPRGEGEFKLWVQGEKGETDWLIISLIESSVTSEETKKELLGLPKPPYEPGEYVLGGCLAFRIAQFHKEWRG